MFTGKRPPRPPASARIPRRQRAALDILEQLTRLQGGRGTMWTPAGPFIQQPGTQFRIGQTSGSGITARSGTTLGFGDVAEVSLATTGPTAATLSSNGVTFTAFNFSAGAIGDTAAKYVVCCLLWGLWVVISAEC